MDNVIIPLAASICVGLLSMPLVSWISVRTGRVAKPRQDRWHSKPTPLLGGIGIFLGFASALLVILFTQKDFHFNLPLLVSAGMMFCLGLFDDYKRINPVSKLIGQIAAATIVIFWGGLVIQFFPWPIANILLTLFWLIGITNGINLLDNMDGIAGGIALIAAGILSIQFWSANDLSSLWLAVALAGSVLAFLVFNFPPARIFMGDSGSMFLGFFLASLAIVRSQQASNVFSVLAVPVMIFLAPIFDTSLVTITRILRGQSPAQGGTDHTTHRLVAFGLSPRQVAVALYIVASIGGVASVAIEALDYDLSLILVPIILVGLSLVTAYLGGIKLISVQPDENRPSVRLALNLVFRRNLFELLLDVVLISISYYLGYWTRYGMDMTQQSMELFMRSWPVAVGTGLLTFYMLGIYRNVWGYLNIYYLLRATAASLLAVIFPAVFLIAFDRTSDYPYGMWALYGVFLFLSLGGSRASFYVLDRLSQRAKPQLRSDRLERVYVYGAGENGEFALRWLTQRGVFEIVGVLDEDNRLWGRSLFEQPILGGSIQIEQLLDSHQVQGIVLSDEHIMHSPVWPQIRNACRKRGLWIRVLQVSITPIHSDP